MKAGSKKQAKIKIKRSNEQKQESRNSVQVEIAKTVQEKERE